MNSDGPSSEQDLSQDASTKNDSNESSVSSDGSKEPSNTLNNSDDLQVDQEGNNYSNDKKMINHQQLQILIHNPQILRQGCCN